MKTCYICWVPNSHWPSAGTGTPSAGTGTCTSPYWHRAGRPILELDSRQGFHAKTGHPVPSLGQSIETPYWHLSNTGTGASMGRPVLALILQLHQRNSDQIVAPFDRIKHGSLLGQYVFEKVCEWYALGLMQLVVFFTVPRSLRHICA